MRLLLPVLFLALATGLHADNPATVAWDLVTVSPMKTSIYVGRVTLTTAVFERQDSALASSYKARVFPWFFWSETGRITVTLTDTELARLARGETTDFTGEAQNHQGKSRRVTGRAFPTNINTGKIKVRIEVDRIELIFNGTYVFGDQPAA